MATIKMLADKCGLSISAVSKALNGRPGIGAQKAEMVRRVAREIGYYPNAAARTLKSHRSRNLGILYRNNMAHEFFSMVLEGIHSQAEQLGYDITFLNNSLHSSGMSYCDHARQRQCDGVIIVEGSFEQEAVKQLLASEIPVVTIDHIAQGHSAILGDNVRAMRDIISYLHAMGHSRVAFIHGEPGGVTDVRLEGFRRGCIECGLTVPEEYIRSANYHNADSAAQATSELLALPRCPTCILYPDDISYLGGIARIEQHGLSIPRDISCFGFDGILIAGALRPRLTTYKQDSDGMGRRAALEIIKAIEEGDSYTPRIMTVGGSIQFGDTVRDINQAAQH
ncbi:MAG: LacI family transcriptional regulator [Clostridiales bacterium]|nr:LacI family transcriptional regulator [Clostridiales bacterium]